MQAAQTWTVIGMGFTLFSWLLVQVRGLDRRMGDGFLDIQRQFGEVRGELADLRADLRLHEQRDH